MKKEVDLKKFVIGIVAFIVIAVLVTAVMIFTKNSLDTNYYGRNSGDNDITNSSNVPNTGNKDKVIGTKKNQKYNQNDLEFIKTQVVDGELEYESIRISGLKNKEIENKINADIIAVENELKQIVLENPNEYDVKYLNEYVNASFSNVLSLAFYGSKYGSNNRNEVNEQRVLNFDLTTGNKLKLEDLFLPGADIDLYVQNSMYGSFLYNSFSESGVFFDPTYWESGECTYIMNEIDELEFIKEFNEYKNSKKDFCFTCSALQISYGDTFDKTAYIEYEKCLDDLVIFNKYATNESIFERDDIGVKNLYVCSDATNFDYVLVDDVTSNFRIDARVLSTISVGLKEMKKYNETFENIKSDIENRKNEIEKMAKSNKDKFYYLCINVNIDSFMPKYYCTYSEQDITYDTFIVCTKEALYEVNKQDYDNWFEDKIISAACANNYFEGNDGYMNINLSESEKEKVKVTENASNIAYNAPTEKEIKNIEDLFKEDSDYLSVIDNTLQKDYGISTDEAANMIQNHKYLLTGYGISFNSSGDVRAFVDYDKFSADSFNTSTGNEE